MTNKLVEKAPYHLGYEDVEFKQGDFRNVDTLKPTAWMDEFGAVITHSQKLFKPELFNEYKTPLYTHPAKTLTDEEIDYCWNHSHGNTPWMKQKAFARAILRKAQE
jgi:hypothetical protein